MQSRNTLSKKNHKNGSVSRKPERAAEARMSVSMDRKPERAVQAKIRDIKQKVIILIGLKPERAVYAKVKDSRKDKVTASNSTIHLGHTCYQRISSLKHQKQQNSKLLRKIVLWNSTYPSISKLPCFKLCKDLWSYAIGGPPSNQ